MPKQQALAPSNRETNEKSLEDAEVTEKVTIDRISRVRDWKGALEQVTTRCYKCLNEG